MERKFLIKTTEFKIEIYNKATDQESWTNYYALSGQPKLEGEKKEELREFRKEKEKSEYEVKLIHKRSGVFKLFDVDNKNFFKDKVVFKAMVNELLEEVCKTRKERQIDKVEHKNFFGAHYQKVGGVLTKAGQINTIGKTANYNDPLTKKTPISKSKRYIGVELEFNDDGNHSERTIAAILKTHNLGRYVEVTRDRSCGWEVRVLVSEDNFIEPLQKIMKVLSDAGFGADNRCGTHVHLDMRNRDVKQVYKNMVLTQSFLRRFIKKSRKNNEYCVKNVFDDFDKHNTQTKGDLRRHAVNSCSYKTHKTLEIRMHHGTLDSDVLIPWIKLLVKIANYKEVVTKKIASLKQAKQCYGFEVDLSSVLKNRIISMFKGN